VIFTEPAKDGSDGETIATTDEEGEVTHVSTDEHPLYPEFTVYKLTILLDSGAVVRAMPLHESSQRDFDDKVARLADEAKAAPRRWGAFWEFKEAFHALRHAYAITAHRAQGSTYDSVFVDVPDILRNPNRQEAFRCLYVACSRPKHKLILA